MSIDNMNVQFIPETLVVPHLSWVRKFPRGFAPTDGMIYFGGVVSHGSTLPPNGWLLFRIVALARDGGLQSPWLVWNDLGD